MLKAQSVITSEKHYYNMTKRKRETPEERDGKRVKQKELEKEREIERGRIVRHEVRQSNVPPTCENLFMHEKAGKASERNEGMGGDVAKRHSGEHKNKERPQERERASKRERESERERVREGNRTNISCLFVTFCLFFQHFIQKQRSNGTDAPQRDEMEWDGMEWDGIACTG